MHEGLVPRVAAFVLNVVTDLGCRLEMSLSRLYPYLANTAVTMRPNPVTKVASPSRRSIQWRWPEMTRNPMTAIPQQPNRTSMKII